MKWEFQKLPIQSLRKDSNPCGGFFSLGGLLTFFDSNPINREGGMMKKILLVGLLVLIFGISGFVIQGGLVSAAETTAKEGIPGPGGGARTADITAGAKDFNSKLGGTGIILAIQGNQVTMQALNDRTKTVTIGVNDASRLRIGDRVNIVGNALMAK
jgi:hypothetical protein